MRVGRPGPAGWDLEGAHRRKAATEREAGPLLVVEQPGRRGRLVPDRRLRAPDSSMAASWLRPGPGKKRPASSGCCELVGRCYLRSAGAARPSRLYRAPKRGYSGPPNSPSHRAGVRWGPGGPGLGRETPQKIAHDALSGASRLPWARAREEWLAPPVVYLDTAARDEGSDNANPILNYN